MTDQVNLFEGIPSEIIQAHQDYTVKYAARLHVILTLAAAIFSIIAVYYIVFNVIDVSTTHSLVMAWFSGISSIVLLAFKLD